MSAATELSGNDQLDLAIVTQLAIVAQIVELTLLGAPIFAGLAAAERLDLARAQIGALVPLVGAKAARDRSVSIACSDRCAFCVYAKDVAVLTVEVERILDRVEREGRLEEVIRRAEIRKTRVKGACPLLGRDGRCTVYAERPRSFRRYHSLDRATCESEERPFAISRLVVAGITPMELVRGPRGEIIDLYEALAQPAWAKLKRTNKSQRQARTAA